MTDEEKEQLAKTQTQTQTQAQAQAGAATATTAAGTTTAPKVDTGEARYCKYCGALLAKNQMFCHKCGEKYGGEEHICPVPTCGKKTTKATCPKCGRSHTCPKCGKTVVSPVCPCGEILDTSLVAVQAAMQTATQKPPAQIRQMSQAEEQKLIESFRVETENPDFQKFHKKLLEREKLLRERNYHNKKQREIIEVFGERPFKIELPDEEEQAMLQKMYASLERTIIEKQRHATQEELEKLYPELRYIHEAENKAEEERIKAEEEEQERRLEQEKRRREMEEKYRAILEGIDQDIQQAKDASRNADMAQKEAEKQRQLAQRAEEEGQLRREREAAEKQAREEAERRARIAAEERQRAEERMRAEAEARAKAAAEAAAARAAAEERARVEAEARAKAEAEAAARERERKRAQEEAERKARINRYLGVYYSKTDVDEITLRFESATTATELVKSKVFDWEPHGYNYSMGMNGSQVEIRLIANPYGHVTKAVSFTGRLNDSGTQLTGYWFHADGTQTTSYTYRKIR